MLYITIHISIHLQGWVTNMVLKVLPQQVPTFWEAIKFAVSHAEDIADNYKQEYFNELLGALLSDKAQCFGRFSDSGELYAMIITRVLFNKQTSEKYLYVQAMYSWKPQPTEVWLKDIDLMRKFAEKAECSYIGCTATNARAAELLESMGFKEQTRVYSLRS